MDQPWNSFRIYRQSADLQFSLVENSCVMLSIFGGGIGIMEENVRTDSLPRIARIAAVGRNAKNRRLLKNFGCGIFVHYFTFQEILCLT